MRLRGKRALVTGGRQGIGRAIVDGFRAEGAVVATCGRGPRPGDLHSDVHWHMLDVADPDAVADVAAQTGELDVLVNNAGVQVEKTVVESSDADWDLVIGANARGVPRSAALNRVEIGPEVGRITRAKVGAITLMATVLQRVFARCLIDVSGR